MSVVYRVPDGTPDGREIGAEAWARLRLGDAADNLRQAGGYGADVHGVPVAHPPAEPVPPSLIWQTGARGLSVEPLAYWLPPPFADASPKPGRMPKPGETPPPGFVLLRWRNDPAALDTLRSEYAPGGRMRAGGLADLRALRDEIGGQLSTLAERTATRAEQARLRLAVPVTEGLHRQQAGGPGPGEDGSEDATWSRLLYVWTLIREGGPLANVRGHLDRLREAPPFLPADVWERQASAVSGLASQRETDLEEAAALGGRLSACERLLREAASGTLAVAKKAGCKPKYDRPDLLERYRGVLDRTPSLSAKEAREVACDSYHEAHGGTRPDEGVIRRALGKKRS